jgi:hypothetical protein
MSEYIPVLIGMAIAALVAYFVFQDAKSRKMNAGLWALGVFALMLVMLPLYLILRKPKPTE